MKMFTRNLYIYTIMTAFCILSCPSCKNDDPDNTIDIVGQFSWEEWKDKAGWKDYSAADYIPNIKLVESIQSKLNDNYSFIIYGSSWCHADCEPQMPRVIKLLVSSGVSEDNIIIIGINKNKTEPVEWINKYFQYFPEQIRLSVPTIIVLYNNNPIGFVKAETNNFPQWQDNINELIP